MDPHTVFCPNRTCLASGQVGKGNIRVHSQKERRYLCTECKQTFAETTGTPFYRSHKPPEDVERVTTLLAFGTSVAAIVAAFHWDERTVQDLEERAGQHTQAVHEHLVAQPRDLGHVQADELRVKAQGLIVWVAMALQVSTRLWLGAAVSPHRDTALLLQLLQWVRASARCRPLLICVDGFSGYLAAIRNTFREPLYNGTRGRPRLRPWDGIHIAQVVKQYAGKRVTGVVHRVVQGSQAGVTRLLQQSQGGGQINTAFIERLNATFRARLAPLVRRGRALIRQPARLHAAVYLVGTVYNFCTYHRSLGLELVIPGQGRRWLRRTPAIAAGITDHCWTVSELLWYRVPRPPELPKRRGRLSAAQVALRKQWAV
jgi:transposase-like protein